MIASLRNFAIALLCMCAGACQQQISWFEPDQYPQRLSDWGLVQSDDQRLELHPALLTYDLVTPLFSDYAQKLRAIYIPEGRGAALQRNGDIDLPVGSILTKTFYYPITNDGLHATDTQRPLRQQLSRDENQIIETRLLVRQPHGWDALPYIWSGDDAYLKITGGVQSLQLVGSHNGTIPYVIPSRNECAGCHASDHSSKAILPIGIKARHLNKTTHDGVNQLQAWRETGILTGTNVSPNDLPQNADWRDTHETLDRRARAYLDINCGHCHNPKGPADTSGLMLDSHPYSSRQLGICKPPVAAGRGAGGRPYGIVPGKPEQSIFSFRMASDHPGIRMPEVGRSVAHAAGVRLIDAWIGSMTGICR